jgi:hypothetical protein
MLRNNWIERNGQSFIDPICGVYVGSVRGLVAESNVITDNGPRVQTSKQPTAGPRGGIVVDLALTPLYGFDLASQYMAPEDGYPAARIAGNIVVAPLGRALSLKGRGMFSVAGNEFTSHGVETNGTLQGVTVLIRNTGVAYEIGQFLGFASMAQSQPAASAATVGNFGGEVLFNSNQVLLASLDTGGLIIISSVQIWSSDDISADGNQCEGRVPPQQILVLNGFFLAWSLRLTNNRFEEQIQFGLSALTFGLMNCTVNNQGTRCFAIVGLALLTVKTPNISLVSALTSPDPCAVFARQLSAAMAKTGFDA